MKRLKNKQGFTLIELIAVLAIMGIVAVFLGSAIVYGIQSYVFARNVDQLSQKAQLAMARIKIELTDVTAISTADKDQITYIIPKSALPSCTLDDGCQYNMKRTGNTITLEGTNPVIAAQVLVDGVTANNNGNNLFTYSQTGGAAWAATDDLSKLAVIKVQISLDMTGSNPLLYQNTITPRANGGLIVPQIK